MALLRSLLFYLFFYVGSIGYTSGSLLMLLFTASAGVAQVLLRRAGR